GLDDAIVGDRGAPLAVGANDHLLAVRAAPADRIVESALERARLSSRDRPVDLLHLALLELLCETVVGLIVFRDDDHARGLPVEPMDDAGTLDASDAREVANPVKERVDERRARLRGSGVHGKARGLVDDRDRIVLVEDLDRDRIRSKLKLDGRRNRQPQLLPRAQAKRRLERRRTDRKDLDVAGLDQTLEVLARILRNALGEEGVEPLRGPFEGELDDPVPSRTGRRGGRFVGRLGRWLVRARQRLLVIGVGTGRDLRWSGLSSGARFASFASGGGGWALFAAAFPLREPLELLVRARRQVASIGEIHRFPRAPLAIPAQRLPSPCRADRRAASLDLRGSCARSMSRPASPRDERRSRRHVARIDRPWCHLRG